MRIQALASPVLAIAILATASGFAGQAFAEPPKKAQDPVVSATTAKDEAEKSLLKLSEDGYTAMRAVRGARMAIFNGKPELASELLNTARTSLDAAAKEAPSFALKTETSIDGKLVSSESKSGKIDLIPIDAELVLADNFVLTPEKQVHVDKANAHFKRGAKKEALTELRLGEIDVTYMRVLLPIDATKKHIDEAIKLTGAHKYYEANLAMKAAEDGLLVDSVTLVDMPDDTGTKAKTN